jgi:hypothetical protein
MCASSMFEVHQSITYFLHHFVQDFFFFFVVISFHPFNL